jgi:8-oxo-dGTP pyrophosphatase MutT (NUDIX family)
MPLRTDLIDAYVFRRAHGMQFLQLLRAHPPLQNSWHPVMGHVEPNETAVQCALRELHEELALTSKDLVGLWSLQEVHPYFLPPDTVMLSPRFAAEVPYGWEPTLNHEHTAHRWTRAADIDVAFLWLGQRAACREVLSVIIPAAPAAAHTRLHPPASP